MRVVPAAETRIAERYRLLDEIGAGASGTVWRALDERLQRQVAVKTVDLAVHHDDPGIVARFRREVQTSAALNSPHVAAIYDSGQDHQVAYMVMELLNGPSLATLLATDGPLDWQRGLTIAVDVASGLADAHAAGVIHRDLKPGNVVLHGGVAKIVDFGIARVTDPGDRTLTSPATVTGTAAYMSPEQASGHEVTPATDLYSLGCLLFALFTGHPPYTAGTPLAQAAAHVHEPAPRLRDQRADTPPALDVLIASLLAKTPHERPDARTAARALTRLRGGPPAGLADADATGPMPPITAARPAIATPRPPTVVPPSQAPSPQHPATAIMPAVAAPPPNDAIPREPERRQRRPRGVLPWLVTAVLALALAAVAWVILSQFFPAAPAPTTPAPAPTTATSSAPASTIPLVPPTVATPTTNPPSVTPTATPTGTPTAPPTQAPTTPAPTQATPTPPEGTAVSPAP